MSESCSSSVRSREKYEAKDGEDEVVKSKQSGDDEDDETGTTTSEDRLALKRKRDVSLTAYERRRALEEGLSLETRARRKRELIQLRTENERLKEERTEFLRKIEELEQETSKQLLSCDYKLASENDLLRVEIEEHKKFIGKFMALCGERPTIKETEEVIYKEGAEAAQQYVMSLVSQSQKDWTRLRIPDRISGIGALKSVQMSYSFKTEMFGSDNASAEQSPRVRINVRFDGLVSNTKPEYCADVLWRVFTDGAVAQRLYGANGLTLRPIGGKMPDANTKVCHFTNPVKDQDVVFVVNRQRLLLAKSTLAPPKKTTGKTSGKTAFPEEFGKTSAIVVATTSTTLYSEDELEKSGLKLDDKNAKRVQSLVVKGAVVWKEDEEHTRAIFVYSVPDEYKVVPGLTLNDMVNEKGSTSRRFTKLMEEACFEFSALLQEEASLVAQGKIHEEDIEVQQKEM